MASDSHALAVVESIELTWSLRETKDSADVCLRLRIVVFHEKIITATITERHKVTVTLMFSFH